jgi:ribosomal RNA-processing protein 12
VTAAVSAVSGSSEQRQPFLAICDALLAALKSIKFQAVAMPHLLSVIASLIGRLRTKVPASNGGMVPAASLLLAEHVKLAGHQRGIEGFEYREAAELVLGAATEVCGPEWVLDLLPLNLDSEEQSEKDRVGRAWLLPVFRTKITNTRMAHFTTYFVPLSERMFGKYREAESRADMEESEQLKKRAGIEAKVYEAVVHQIWALFPGYCDLPVDLSEVGLPPQQLQLQPVQETRELTCIHIMPAGFHEAILRDPLECPLLAGTPSGSALPRFAASRRAE